MQYDVTGCGFAKGYMFVCFLTALLLMSEYVWNDLMCILIFITGKSALI